MSLHFFKLQCTLLLCYSTKAKTQIQKFVWFLLGFCLGNVWVNLGFVWQNLGFSLFFSFAECAIAIMLKGEQNE